MRGIVLIDGLVLWMNVLSYQRGISEAKWHVGQDAFLLMVTILLLCGPALYFVLSQENECRKGRDGREIIDQCNSCGDCRKKHSVPTLLCKHISSWKTKDIEIGDKLAREWSTFTLLTNSGLWEIMVSTLHFSQKGCAKLWDPISAYWKALKQYSDFSVRLCPSQATVAVIWVLCILKFLSDFKWKQPVFSPPELIYTIKQILTSFLPVPVSEPCEWWVCTEPIAAHLQE